MLFNEKPKRLASSGDKAFDFCFQYHKKQIRKSGEPYYIHPIAVAEEIIKLQLDDTSIIVALLHDVIEDTELTKENIIKEFSE